MTAKPEPASPRKLRRALELGDKPHSELLGQGVVFGAVLGVATAWMKAFYAHAEQALKWSLQNQSTDFDTLKNQSTKALEFLVAYSAPVLTLVIVARLAVRVIEARVPGAGAFGAVNPKRPQRLRRRSLLTWDAAFATFTSWLVVFGLATATLAWFQSHATLLIGTLGSPWAASRVLGATTMTLLAYSFMLWTSVGGLGLVVSYLLWVRRNRMSHQEKQLENREVYGDPTIANARQRLRQQLLESASTDLTQASIVIVNPGHEAAALRYDHETDAPRLVAAARVRGVSMMTAEALRLGISVVESPGLATALCRGAVGETIAEAHYASVAEILSSVMSSDTAVV